MTDNALINFLAAYGPTANGSNMYDEFVLESAKKADISPIELSDRSGEIAASLTSDEPISVLLTGTAGDGKTYTARRVLNILSEKEGNIWQNMPQDEVIVHCKKNGHQIHFIKDLSEIREEKKRDLIPRLVKAFYPEGGASDIYLLCVNDGHLIKTWREYTDGGDLKAKAIFDAFQRLLRMMIRKRINWPFG